MNDTIIGVDLAKSIFQVHGALMATGEIQFKRKLTREQFRVFMPKLAPSVVIFEACGSANYRAGQMEAMREVVLAIRPASCRDKL